MVCWFGRLFARELDAERLRLRYRRCDVLWREQQRLLTSQERVGRRGSASQRSVVALDLVGGQPGAVTREDPDGRVIVDREALVGARVVEREPTRLGDCRSAPPV